MWPWVVGALAVAGAALLLGSAESTHQVKTIRIETQRNAYYVNNDPDPNDQAAVDARAEDQKLSTAAWVDAHRNDPDPDLRAATQGLAYNPPSANSDSASQGTPSDDNTSSGNETQGAGMLRRLWARLSGGGSGNSNDAGTGNQNTAATSNTPDFKIEKDRFEDAAGGFQKALDDKSIRLRPGMKFTDLLNALGKGDFETHPEPNPSANSGRSRRVEDSRHYPRPLLLPRSISRQQWQRGARQERFQQRNRWLLDVEAAQ